MIKHAQSTYPDVILTKAGAELQIGELDRLQHTQRGDGGACVGRFSAAHPFTSSVQHLQYPRYLTILRGAAIAHPRRVEQSILRRTLA
jgi:hypothetical protein